MDCAIDGDIGDGELGAEGVFVGISHSGCAGDDGPGSPDALAAAYDLSAVVGRSWAYQTGFSLGKGARDGDLPPLPINQNVYRLGISAFLARAIAPTCPTTRFRHLDLPIYLVGEGCFTGQNQPQPTPPRCIRQSPVGPSHGR